MLPLVCIAGMFMNLGFLQIFKDFWGEEIPPDPISASKNLGEIFINSTQNIFINLQAWLFTSQKSIGENYYTQNLAFLRFE